LNDRQEIARKASSVQNDARAAPRGRVQWPHSPNRK
jgi:hypothetical protein